MYPWAVRKFWATFRTSWVDVVTVGGFKVLLISNIVWHVAFKHYTKQLWDIFLKRPALKHLEIFLTLHDNKFKLIVLFLYLVFLRNILNWSPRSIVIVSETQILLYVYKHDIVCSYVSKQIIGIINSNNGFHIS